MIPRFLGEHRQRLTETGTMQQELCGSRNQGLVPIHVKCCMSTGQSSEDEYWVHMSKVQENCQDMQFKFGNHQ